jgi:hypothetical protein
MPLSKEHWGKKTKIKRENTTYILVKKLDFFNFISS